MNSKSIAKEENRTIRPWRFFEIVLPGQPPKVVTAIDAVRAMRRAWNMWGAQTALADYSEFCTHISCKPCQQPVRDGYEQLRRDHRVSLRLGQRVRIKPPGMAVLGLGFVVYPQCTANKVHVIIDGTTEPTKIAPECIQAI